MVADSDGIEISPDRTLSMDAIAPGVHGLRIVFVNVVSITHSDGSWTLIGAGLPMSDGLIRSWAEKRFDKPPKAIVLTHGHFDHVGGAQKLADRWNVPILAHEKEFPYLTGQKEYPPPNVGAGGGLMSLLSPMYPRAPVDLGSRLRPLHTTGYVAELPEWEVLPTPGHTPGHVSFFRPSDRTLIAGDAFCTTKPESFFEAALAQQPELHGPPAYFTWNWDLAAESIQRLAELGPQIVATGHGKPLAGPEVRESLKQLAAQFGAPVG